MDYHVITHELPHADDDDRINSGFFICQPVVAEIPQTNSLQNTVQDTKFGVINELPEQCDGRTADDGRHKENRLKKLRAPDPLEENIRKEQTENHLGGITHNNPQKDVSDRIEEGIVFHQVDIILQTDEFAGLKQVSFQKTEVNIIHQWIKTEHQIDQKSRCNKEENVSLSGKFLFHTPPSESWSGPE